MGGGGGSKSKSRSSRRRPTKRQQHESRMSRGAMGAYNKGFRGISAFGGAFSGGNIGDPNSPSYGMGTPAQVAAAKKHLKTVAAKTKTSTVASKAKDALSKVLNISDKVLNTKISLPSFKKPTFSSTYGFNPGDVGLGINSPDSYSKFSGISDSLTSQGAAPANTNRFGVLGTIASDIRKGITPLTSALTSAPQAKSVWGITKSAITGDTTQESYSTLGLKQFFQKQALQQLAKDKFSGTEFSKEGLFGPSLPSYIGEQPTTADASFYVNQAGEAVPQTAESLKSFPNLAQNWSHLSHLGSDPLTDRGELQAYVSQPNIYSAPSLVAKDIYSANLASRDRGEFPGVPGPLSKWNIGPEYTITPEQQATIAAGIAKVTGDKWRSQATETNDPVGVGVASGRLGYDGWTSAMKQAFAPGAAFNTDVNLGVGDRISLGDLSSADYSKGFEGPISPQAQGMSIADVLGKASDAMPLNPISNLTKPIEGLAKLSEWNTQLETASEERLNRGIPVKGTDEWNALAPVHKAFWSKPENVQAMKELNFKRGFRKMGSEALASDAQGPLGRIAKSLVALGKQPDDKNFAQKIWSSITQPDEGYDPGISIEGFINNFVARTGSEIALGGVTNELDDGKLSVSEIPGIGLGAWDAMETPGTKAYDAKQTAQSWARMFGGALTERTPGEVIKRAVGEAFGYDATGQRRNASTYRGTGSNTTRDLRINQLAPTIKSQGASTAQAENQALSSWISDLDTTRSQYQTELDRLSKGQSELQASRDEIEKEYSDVADFSDIDKYIGQFGESIGTTRNQLDAFNAQANSQLIQAQQSWAQQYRPQVMGVRGTTDLAMKSQSPKDTFGRRARQKRTTTQAPTISNLAATWGAPMTLNV